MLVCAPTFEVAHQIRQELENLGSKLNKDGCPTVKVSARELVARLLEISDACMVVPAHVWTPWYGMLGSKSGFDSLDECFEDMAAYVHAVKTRLSSDPEMNLGVAAVSKKTIVSFSDAHSLSNMGRELTIFEGNPSYPDLAFGLKKTD
jgi:PHP family Zn ribbon phosphoesterase